MADRKIIRAGKEYIDQNKIFAFRKLVNDYLQAEQGREYCNHLSMFKDLFIHMCLRGRLEMAQDFVKYYQSMSEVDQIVLRPTFTYCKVLAQKHKHKKMVTWLLLFRKTTF